MSLKFSSLKIILAEEPKFKLRQAISAVYAQFVQSWEEVTVLSKDLRARLKKECPLSIKARALPSADKRSMRVAFYFGNDIVEGVLMRHQDRNTVCVSSQVGCSLACSFCLTGTLGCERNLSEDEIINQVLYFSRLLKKQNQRVTNIVFMGMGEPLLNYEAVLGAIRKLNDSGLFNIGARHISISTSGIVPGIKLLTKEPLQINLSVSLNAADNETRSSLMPINKKYPLEILLNTVNDYIKKTRRRVMLEYILLKDINDSPKQANSLIKLLRRELDELYFINLIKYNPTGSHQPSSKHASTVFKRILEKEGLTVVERYRFGRDIGAACGQLAAKNIEKDKPKNK